MLFVWSGWRAVCGGAGWVEDCAQRSIKSWALTCRTCEKDLLVSEKRAKKKGCQGCCRCEIPHSWFYYPLSPMCWDSNDEKNQKVTDSYSPTWPKSKQSHAINFSRHAQKLAVLISWAKFSSASQGRFLFKGGDLQRWWLRGAAALPC